MKNSPTDINDEYGAVHEPYIPKPEPGLVYRNDGHKHLKSFGTLT